MYGYGLGGVSWSGENPTGKNSTFVPRDVEIERLEDEILMFPLFIYNISIQGYDDSATKNKNTIKLGEFTRPFY